MKRILKPVRFYLVLWYVFKSLCFSWRKTFFSLKISGNKPENHWWQTPPAPSVLRWMLSLQVMMEEHLGPSIMFSCERVKLGILTVHDAREKDRRTNRWATYHPSESSTKHDGCFTHRGRQTWLVEGDSPGDTHMTVLGGHTGHVPMSRGVMKNGTGCLPRAFLFFVLEITWGMFLPEETSLGEICG